MTQSPKATTTTNFAEEIRIYNSELIPMLVGKTIKSAKASNDLPYQDKNKVITAKTGLWLEIDGFTNPIGLFRWDLLPAIIEWIDNKPQALVLEDILHKTAREALKPGTSEKDFLDTIANAITGKTVSSKSYIGKRANGGEYQAIILTIE